MEEIGELNEKFFGFSRLLNCWLYHRMTSGTKIKRSIKTKSEGYANLK